MKVPAARAVRALFRRSFWRVVPHRHRFVNGADLIFQWEGDHALGRGGMRPLLERERQKIARVLGRMTWCLRCGRGPV